MTEGPDFTTGACPASNTLSWTRNAGNTIWCGKAAGHPEPHSWAIEWSDYCGQANLFGWTCTFTTGHVSEHRFTKHPAVPADTTGEQGDG